MLGPPRLRCGPRGFCLADAHTVPSGRRRWARWERALGTIPGGRVRRHQVVQWPAGAEAVPMRPQSSLSPEILPRVGVSLRAEGVTRAPVRSG